MFSRCEYLCPASIQAAAPGQREKFAGAGDLIQQLQFAYSTAWKEAGLDFCVDADQIQLLLHRLDHNCFDSGLFPLACFFNHSCRPNCEGVAGEDCPDTGLGQDFFEVKAVAHLQPGEQLCISYLPDTTLYLPTAQRQEMLWNSYAFRCQCSRCLEGPNPTLDGLLGLCQCKPDAVCVATEES